MSHQDGLGDNGPETTGLSQPDDGDDRMEKKSENVAHARDGIKLKNLKNSGRLRNSPTTRSCPRIAEQVNLALGTSIDKDVVRRILALHYRPEPNSRSLSWRRTTNALGARRHGSEHAPD